MCRYGYSQETKTPELITSIAEQLAEDESDPEAVQVFTEKLSDLADDPVNLNSASPDELSRLFFLTDFQIKALADYTHSSGKIYSVYELANIPGFDQETVQLMTPFITLENIPMPSPGKTAFSNTILTNAIYKTPYDSSCSGSPLKLLFRYKFSVSGFTGGVTAEKDAGEKLFSGNPPATDFFSAYLSYKGQGLIRKLVIGDFSARFGQGTGINTGTASFLSLTAPTFMSARTEIRPYTSADENNFFRGAAAEFGKGNFLVSLFLSANKIDATTDPGSDSIMSFYTSGLHNSASLVLKKDVLTDLSYGLHVSYNFKNFRAGILGTSDRFSIPIISHESDPQNIHDFSGNRNDIVSAYYNALFKKILLFGELSFNDAFNRAYIQGLSMRLADRLIVNGMLRSYDPGYFSLHGKGPGGGSGNETGINANFTFEAAKHLFISGGSEIKNYPWLKFRCSSPSVSIREELRIKYLPSDITSIEGLYNFRSAMTDEPESTGIPLPRETKTDYFRASVKYSPSGNITFSTRIDYKRVRNDGSTGVLLFQDISYTFSKIPLSVWARYCIFRTDSWDARLYAYENDLLYSFNIPALSGNGTRNYLMLKYEFLKTLEMRLKYGFTSVNSKPEAQDLKFQIKILF